MLACVFDENECRSLLALVGKHAFMQTESSETVKFEEQSPTKMLTRKGSSMVILQSAIEHAQQIKVPPTFLQTVMSMDQFNKEQMGAKSNNIRVMSTKVPSWIHLPESICLPFQVMEYALQQCDPVGNARIGRLITRLSKTKKLVKMSARLIRCKQIVLALEFNEKDEKLAQLKSHLLAFGVSEADFPKAWLSIKKVWASKFNERAFLAVRKIGVRLD
jgi:alpha-glucan, water dikinase